MTEKFLVVYEWSGRNFGGFAPDVPGCGSTGQSLDEIRKNLREGLEAHLQWMAQENDPLPRPVSTTYIPDAEGAEDLKLPGYYYVVELLDVTMPTTDRHLMSA